ncbi:MAG: outer membrane lipoprotein-sorting protein [Leptospirales bacterium]
MSKNTIQKRLRLVMAGVVITLLTAFLFPVLSKTKSAASIIAKSERLLRGDSSYGIYEMSIHNPRWKVPRIVEIETWSKGTEKSFMVIHKPKKDKGVTFLKIGNEMWQYIPKIEKIIKIPPSMMMQSWMGSDITNDDMVKESSMERDYTKIIESENKSSWTIKLTPLPNAPVVWDRITIVIQKSSYLPTKAQYYDEDGELVRTILYEKHRKMGDRTIPTLMKFIPETKDKKGHITELLFKEIKFNTKIADSIFTIRSLKRRSR